jgi:hypothetical protein
MSPTKISRLDRAGIFVSLLCAVHCAALPLLLSLLPLAGLTFLQSEWMEVAIIGTSLTLACLSLRRSYKEHRKILPFIIACIGFCALGAGHLISARHEWILLTAGGLLIATAHLINWRFHHTCNHRNVNTPSGH